MSNISFEETKEKINTIEKIKTKKRKEMFKLYSELTKDKNQEYLDILMIQIGKDIEENFPGVKFRLISRIKTESSFSDKLENDLSGLVDTKKIEDIKIFDIIALSIIIEEVPDSICTYDDSFNSHITELINARNESKQNLLIHKNEVGKYNKRIEDLQEKKKSKNNLKAKNNTKINQIKDKTIKEYLKTISNEFEKDLKDIDMQINNIKSDITDRKRIISRTKDRLYKENNICNHVLADFIVTNLTKFNNVKTLGLTDIPKRLKQKENYDGYKATHNCYHAEIKDEKLNFVCEIQGKSMDAFYVADRGKAALYHTKQKQEPGKIIKQKALPNIVEINKAQDIEKIRKKVPIYRIYAKMNNKDKVPHIYKLSFKESFILYYYNQLFGNKELKIKPEKEQLNEVINTSKLDDSNYKIYKNFEYKDFER